MIIRDCWYVVAWSDDVTDRPLARTLGTEPIVLYRTADGAVACLRDECSHRAAPLSLGRTLGSHVQCAYHGIEFDRTAGAC
ncbi:Rieske 2Fe-2S domain-containing protein [Amycolatopsis pithecellobii]|uniref:Rieske 2Fe-2S domain-containing protein n=1 Tax=Amycolatopsis pithecellobii TaxID=664692 RepID=A0A6N7Z501_9PSEU|nr:Rieske 2Fe-2S domain-containing protein [Amycolatopsis pithecellobii]MTD55500.1 Rieske 2Fe-2S domain-containing protein [Amycolatopsis pithecellobii]